MLINILLISPKPFVNFIYFLVVLGIELRALCTELYQLSLNHLKMEKLFFLCRLFKGRQRAGLGL